MYNKLLLSYLGIFPQLLKSFIYTSALFKRCYELGMSKPLVWNLSEIFWFRLRNDRSSLLFPHVSLIILDHPLPKYRKELPTVSSLTSHPVAITRHKSLLYLARRVKPLESALNKSRDLSKSKMWSLSISFLHLFNHSKILSSYHIHCSVLLIWHEIANETHTIPALIYNLVGHKDNKQVKLIYQVMILQQTKP